MPAASTFTPVKQHDQSIDTSNIPLMVEMRETDQRIFKKVFFFYAFMPSYTLKPEG